MKQALAQLGAAQRAKQGRTPRAHARPSRGSANGLDRHSECVRAAMLFARWQRCGMGRISLMNGCACGIDAAIEIGGLDAMILDLLTPALAQADAGRHALSDMLQNLAQPDNELTTAELSALLDALGISIASIEEHSAMR